MSNIPALTFHYNTQVSFDESVAAGYMKHYIPVPETVAQAFNDAGITHLQGQLNEQEFRRVLHTRADGSACLKFGLTWLKQAGLPVGTEVTVLLEPDPDPDRIDIPIELLGELQAEPEIMEAFAQLPTGKQKTLAYSVERAKRIETRVRRARAIVDDLRQSLAESD